MLDKEQNQPLSNAICLARVDVPVLFAVRTAGLVSDAADDLAARAALRGLLLRMEIDIVAIGGDTLQVTACCFYL